MPEWLTAAEAAKYLRVDRRTIYRWAEAGMLPYKVFKTGGGRRFDKVHLDALLEEPRKEGTEDGQR